MDRSYKAPELVHVFQSQFGGPLLTTFCQGPYAVAGFDNFKYKEKLYKGYVNSDTGKVFILLDDPL